MAGVTTPIQGKSILIFYQFLVEYHYPFTRVCLSGTLLAHNFHIIFP